jgi:hypothetical protein
MEMKLRPRDSREPLHHATVEFNSLCFRGFFLKSLRDKIQRDTVLIPEPYATQLIAQFSEESEVRKEINEFNSWAREREKEWQIGNTATLKKIERLAINNRVPKEFNLRTVAHHFGAVPCLTVGNIHYRSKEVFVTVLPSLNGLPIRNQIEEKTELLQSFQRYLPHLFTAYYEQIGYYLRAIFFGADETHIIKYAHRIRSIAKSSIRGKIIELKKDHDPINRLIAEELIETYRSEISTAESVDAFAHLVSNYIYTFFRINCREHMAKYEERLSKISWSDGILGGEDNPVSFIRECARHINTPENNDVFITKINGVKNDWLKSLGEAAAFIGEIKRSCKKSFSAPTIFVGYHFDIDENDNAYEQLNSAIEEHWKHVQLFQGRHLDRNIRWSLLGKIWFADAYLFLIPPTFISGDGTPKPLSLKEDWLLLEFIYTTLIGKHCITMKPKVFNAEVFETFKAQLEGFEPIQEIAQVSKYRWSQNLKFTKQKWLQTLRDHERLPSMNILEVNALESFEKGTLNVIHKMSIEFIFQATYWYLDSDALLLLQILLRQFPLGRGTIKIETLRKRFNLIKQKKYTFPQAQKKLLSFNLDLFLRPEPLIVQNREDAITLRLADVLEVLYNEFCYHPPNFTKHIIGRLLSTNDGDS